MSSCHRQQIFPPVKIQAKDNEILTEMFYVTPKFAKVTFIPAAVITFSWIPSKTTGYHWYLFRPLLLFKMPFESLNSFFFEKYSFFIDIWQFL